jgi:hypothetical protein
MERYLSREMRKRDWLSGMGLLYGYLLYELYSLHIIIFIIFIIYLGPRIYQFTVKCTLLK